MKEKHNILGDYINLKRGYDLPHQDRKDGEIPVVSSSGLTGWHNLAKVKAPGVVTGRYGTLGEVFYLSQDFWPLNTSLYVENFKGNDPKFINYYLKIILNENFNSAGAVPGVNRNYLHKIKVPSILPLKTQKKIAAVLSAYDDLIENNKRRIALLEKMAEEIYREWFVRFRFPGWQNTEFEKGIPKDWDFKPIDYLCKEKRDGIKKENLSEDQKYLGLEHLSKKSISIQEYTTADTVNSNKLKFQARDILFGKIRPYLHKIALAHFSGICSTDTIILRAKKDFYVGFLLFTVFSETFVELATVSSKGTKMPRADWDFLKQLKIAIPDDKILMRFNQKFECIFQEISLLLRTNEILIKNKNSLLPRLISGKLSVEDLDITFPPSMQ
jgi:type I restriction enzyme S subunit